MRLPSILLEAALNPILHVLKRKYGFRKQLEILVYFGVNGMMCSPSIGGIIYPCTAWPFLLFSKQSTRLSMKKPIQITITVTLLHLSWWLHCGSIFPFKRVPFRWPNVGMNFYVWSDEQSFSITDPLDVLPHNNSAWSLRVSNAQIYLRKKNNFGFEMTVKRNGMFLYEIQNNSILPQNSHQIHLLDIINSYSQMSAIRSTSNLKCEFFNRNVSRLPNC